MKTSKKNPALFMSETPFLNLSDDIVLNIFLKLDEDPRHWARVACVCTKFSSLIRTICCKQKCLNSINSVVSDLLSSKSSFGGHPFIPPGNWWASLHKLGVCCPGLLHAGILLENSDFGLERDIGPDHRFSIVNCSNLAAPGSASSTAVSPAPIPHSGVSWSLYDDLYFDTMYVPSEVHSPVSNANVTRTITDEDERVVNNTTIATTTRRDESERVITVGNHLSGLRMKRKSCGPIGSHLATGTWNLSREQGNKLLASRFRGDCLYICDWPGCLHTEEKRRYMLFRGVFKGFKGSRVWRTINDGNQSKIALGCAFCSCKDTYDLHSSFCLRRVFGYHDDGEPVVRAFVCENGHVSGAWTERPMYA